MPAIWSQLGHRLQHRKAPLDPRLSNPIRLCPAPDHRRRANGRKSATGPERRRMKDRWQVRATTCLKPSRRHKASQPAGSGLTTTKTQYVHRPHYPRTEAEHGCVNSTAKPPSNGEDYPVICQQDLNALRNISSPSSDIVSRRVPSQAAPARPPQTPWTDYNPDDHNPALQCCWPPYQNEHWLDNVPHLQK